MDDRYQVARRRYDAKAVEEMALERESRSNDKSAVPLGQVRRGRNRGVGSRCGEVAREARKRFAKVELERSEVVERNPGRRHHRLRRSRQGGEGRLCEARIQGSPAAPGVAASQLGIAGPVVAGAAPTLKKGAPGWRPGPGPGLPARSGGRYAYARSIGLKLREPDFTDGKAVEANRREILEAVAPRRRGPFPRSGRFGTLSGAAPGRCRTTPGRSRTSPRAASS